MESRYRPKWRFEGGSSRLVLTIDTMYDEPWTKMAVLGWESQLGKLAGVLAQRPTGL